MPLVQAVGGHLLVQVVNGEMFLRGWPSTHWVRRGAKAADMSS